MLESIMKSVVSSFINIMLPFIDFLVNSVIWFEDPAGHIYMVQCAVNGHHLEDLLYKN